MYPTILDIVVDAVARATLADVCGPQEAQNGLGWATGEQDIMFYAENGRIVEKNPIWFQGMLTTLIHMFEQVELDKNLWNTKSIT